MKREKEAERIFEELMAINMPDLMKGINLYVQEAQKTSRRKKFKETLTLKHVIIKPPKAKEKILKARGEK